ncbi:CLUMA_CG014055, isoform A [Clunio marinus]|uniref:CLUMA_CG014055, isoform A n=1 Tax=Clunio marinus TaxID=568069 RepID=A0A1J1IKP9_9DIPT|nr:CLUMA_CG014055, isoform A [Clunio marinus]
MICWIYIWVMAQGKHSKPQSRETVDKIPKSCLPRNDEIYKEKFKTLKFTYLLKVILLILQNVIILNKTGEIELMLFTHERWNVPINFKSTRNLELYARYSYQCHRREIKNRNVEM